MRWDACAGASAAAEEQTHDNSPIPVVMVVLSMTAPQSMPGNGSAWKTSTTIVSTSGPGSSPRRSGSRAPDRSAGRMAHRRSHRPAATAALHDFRVGARLGCLLAVAAAAYLALSPHGPHRTLIAAVTAAAFVLAVSVEAGPVARWIERRDVDAHMTLWCASFVAFAALLSALDGGLASPFVSVFYVSVAFAASALPRRGVLLISVLNVAGLFVVGVAEDLAEAHRFDSLGLRAAGLVATAAVSASVSRDRSRRASALRQSQEEVVHRLARVVEFRDNDTGDHVDRMSRYSALIAEALGWSAAACRELQLAAALHDVGKVAIPDAVLLKPGPLTVEERALMERHCQAGFDMLSGSGSPLLDAAATIALTHHERYDGAGYPAGLAGEQIPPEGRIVAVADVFDALTSDRVYKKAMSVSAAVEIMRQASGSQFDPRVIDAFLQRLDCIVELHAAARHGDERSDTPGSPARSQLAAA